MPAPARVAAYEALRLAATTDLGDALARTRDRLGDARDRSLATDLAIGTMRWRGRIDYQLQRASGRPLARLDPEVLDALRLGIYQLLFLERVPASAIVNDTVALVKRTRVKSAAPLVNAVLRRIGRELSALSWPPRDAGLLEYFAVVHSHPAWLIERWIARYGAARTEAWLAFNNKAPALTLAANRRLCTAEVLADRLASEHVRVERTAVAPFGLRVIEGNALSSPAFRDGWCVVQDEASQVVSALLLARHGHVALDACAAPGGKTVAIAADVNGGGRVVASDVRPRRMRILAATLARCRIDNVSPVQIGTAGSLPFRDATFDRILVDAPCSGLGTVRRDPDIKWKRTAQDLPMLARTQLDLLRRVAPLVRVGGRLVYSTCSSEPDENEEVVAAFLASAPEFGPVPLGALDDIPMRIRQCATPEGYLRTYPDRDRLEAFFGAVLERQAM